MICRDLIRGRARAIGGADVFIVDQKREKVVNIDMALQIHIDGCVIVAYSGIFHGELILGAYETNERAAEVFRQMLEECFAPPMMVFQNMVFSEEAKRAVDGIPNLIIRTSDGVPRVEKIERSCWYMPRE